MAIGNLHGPTLYVVENGKTVKYRDGVKQIEWERTLTLDELNSLADDPYQMFKQPNIEPIE